MSEEEQDIPGRKYRTLYFGGGGLAGVILGVIFQKPILFMLAIGLAAGVVIATEMEKKQLNG